MLTGIFDVNIWRISISSIRNLNTYQRFRKLPGRDVFDGSLGPSVFSTPPKYLKNTFFFCLYGCLTVSFFFWKLLFHHSGRVNIIFRLKLLIHLILLFEPGIETALGLFLNREKSAKIQTEKCFTRFSLRSTCSSSSSATFFLCWASLRWRPSFFCSFVRP